MLHGNGAWITSRDIRAFSTCFIIEVKSKTRKQVQKASPESKTRKQHQKDPVGDCWARMFVIYKLLWSLPNRRIVHP
ncbi:hypothetical protein EJF18_10496 [Clavispora lusitaniae]|uniref:Uncharacterized protein n=1 Tax=Clavispora lusitaniae TaxID=36911 RepID=A0ACD0WDE1_CLALS|nr:hypothetical protein EJF14_10496 [Clavispora lusitaniae]QFZ31296.1 hypothetical protein EJF16_10496 [Clavispora lusitaniae]QFZ36964.1 hypothetical protein EJF15_10496 [Clavispora lusitaniae]QFZ42648.1 hypothetical protein EJF18_10496 [Clavispora lusitaniae]QFZ48324.1 hypothetical protein EJF17_10496 [Clavispora lusitaniae]